MKNGYLKNRENLNRSKTSTSSKIYLRNKCVKNCKDKDYSTSANWADQSLLFRSWKSIHLWTSAGPVYVFRILLHWISITKNNRLIRLNLYIYMNVYGSYFCNKFRLKAWEKLMRFKDLTSWNSQGANEMSLLCFQYDELFENESIAMQKSDNFITLKMFYSQNVLYTHCFTKTF